MTFHSKRAALRAVSAAALVAGTLAGAVVATAAPAAAASTAKTALINADTIDTSVGIAGGISLEQYAAQKAGYTVTVVSGATWGSMTKAQFAHYQLLIIGDPSCGDTPTSVITNAATWIPVVMGKAGLGTQAGNRTVIGTDPVFHYQNGAGNASPTDPSNPSTAGAEHLVQAGITYAGGVPGATGLYWDTSCDDPGGELALLNQLSTTGSGFTENTNPPCGSTGEVAIVASNPAFSGVSGSDLDGWGCSVHITYPTFPADFQALAVATDTPTHPTCGTDPSTHTTACGEAYVLVAGIGLVATAPDLSLSPASGSGGAGGTHTVTATVKVGSVVQVGKLVTWTVSGINGGATGTCVPSTCKTNSSGKVTFTYKDTHGVGKDSINASVDLSGTVEHATAAMNWLSGGPTIYWSNIANGAHYYAPRTPMCLAKDSGGVAIWCSAKTTLVGRSSPWNIVSFTETATDSAGMTTKVTGKYYVSQYYLLGAPVSSAGVFTVKLGMEYTFVANIGGIQAPTYYRAVPAGATWTGMPNISGGPFSVQVPGKFAMLIHILPLSMGHYTNWNIGAKSYGVMHLVHLHVS